MCTARCRKCSVSTVLCARYAVPVKQHVDLCRFMLLLVPYPAVLCTCESSQISIYGKHHLQADPCPHAWVGMGVGMGTLSTLGVAQVQLLQLLQQWRSAKPAQAEDRWLV